jgi:3-deoxy-D-manno-octulosonic-acid transferase
MRFFYSLLLYLLLPLILLRLLFRSSKNPAYRKRVGERFGLISPAPIQEGIWVHAVSVGESIAAVKLVKGLQAKYPDRSFTVTCGTPTGSDIIQSQLGNSVYHVYAPYDLPGCVKRFFAKIKPDVGIIMEKELWPNLLHYANQAGTRLMISNMLLSDRSFKRYQKFSGLSKAMLSNVDHFAAQTKQDADRIIELGAPNTQVSVVGNLKYDFSAVNASALDDRTRYRQQLADTRPIWLAGSTHDGEESLVLKTHAALIERVAELLLIIVPRHPERFDDVYQHCKSSFTTQRRSNLAQTEPLSPQTQVLLVDSMGELNRFIAISDWCFIGGSMVPVGGHNVLEACHAGVPVLFGKYMDNARQVAEQVQLERAGIQVKDQAALLAASRQLLNNPEQRKQMGQRGLALIEANQGALNKTLALLEPWL